MSTKHSASKDSLEAMHENDGHTTKEHSNDHVPGDETAHSHSHAAHPNPTLDSHLPAQGNAPAERRQGNNEPAVAHQTQSRSSGGKN